jgi:hypothetical protein
MVSRDFLLAGNATFTVKLPETRREGLNPHYTYKLQRSEGNAKFPPTMFVKLLTGPNNEDDFTYLGKMNEATGRVVTTHASSMDDSAFPVKLVNRVLSRVMAGDVQPIIDAGFDVMHEGRCGRCGRKLTTPASIECGIGPECIKKL